MIVPIPHHVRGMRVADQAPADLLGHVSQVFGEAVVVIAGQFLYFEVASESAAALREGEVVYERVA